MKFLLILAALTTLGAPPAWRKRGADVQKRFHAYSTEFTATLKAVEKAVRANAPSLLPKLNPAPTTALPYGYGILPLILEHPRKEVSSPLPAQSTSYSWPLTIRYIDREESSLSEIKEKLSVLKQLSTVDRVQILSKIVDDLALFRTNHQLIDHHIKHNELWQASIAANRSLFDERLKAFASNPDFASYQIGRLPPEIKFTRTGSVLTVFVPLCTDISDSAFQKKFEAAVEETWRVQTQKKTYELDVKFRTISHAKPPKRGAHIDTEQHTGRFPKDCAVLTTGAQATYALPGRAVILGPQPTEASVLAHEFGHILGFADSYFRGYKDLGADGFEIIEVVPHPEDIMSSPEWGAPSIQHFEALENALTASLQSK